MSNYLSKADIKSFNDDGFLLVPGLLDAATVAGMHRAIDEITSGAESLGDVAELEPSSPDVLRRIWSPSARHAAFKNVQEDPRILDRLEGLIGPDIVFHHSKLNMKGPKVGTAVEWHQDISYYPHSNSRLVACIIYLDDADDGNECPHAIRGSHKKGVLSHRDGSYFRGRVSQDNLPKDQENVSLAGKAGSAVFLHCKTLHMSPTIRSNRQRRVFIPAYRSADALPIFFGPHAAHNEPGTYLLRGRMPEYVTL